MTEQSNSAAERSAHVHRGDAPTPADWPVVRMPDGTWKLKSVVALENRIAELEAENADLSANQCLHNIHGDEAGNPYCSRIAELEDELSIWRSVFPDIAPERVLPDRRLLLNRITKMTEVMELALRYFENRIDVNDGDYGVPEANQEMYLYTYLKEVLDNG